jgi:hypothetical protein
MYGRADTFPTVANSDRRRLVDKWMGDDDRFFNLKYFSLLFPYQICYQTSRKHTFSPSPKRNQKTSLLRTQRIFSDLFIPKACTLCRSGSSTHIQIYSLIVIKIANILWFIDELFEFISSQTKQWIFWWFTYYLVNTHIIYE